jgi:hypothetical protein
MSPKGSRLGLENWKRPAERRNRIVELRSRRRWGKSMGVPRARQLTNSHMHIDAQSFSVLRVSIPTSLFTVFGFEDNSENLAALTDSESTK